MSKNKKPGKTGQMNNKRKDTTDFQNCQVVYQNCTLDQISKLYFDGYDEFEQAFRPDTPKDIILEIYDIIFKEKHCTITDGVLTWKL